MQSQFSPAQKNGNKIIFIRYPAPEIFESAIQYNNEPGKWNSQVHSHLKTPSVLATMQSNALMSTSLFMFPTAPPTSYRLPPPPLCCLFRCPVPASCSGVQKSSHPPSPKKAGWIWNGKDMQVYREFFFPLPLCIDDWGFRWSKIITCRENGH